MESQKPAGPVYVFSIGSLGDSIIKLPAIYALKDIIGRRPLVLITNAPSNGNYVPSWEVFRLSALFSNTMTFTSSSQSKRSNLLSSLNMASRLRFSNGGPLFYFCHRGSSPRMVRKHDIFFRRLCALDAVGIAEALQPSIVPSESGRLKPQTPEYKRFFDLVQRYANRTMKIKTTGLILPDSGAVASIDKIWETIPKKPLVAVGLWSNRQSTRWPLDRFAEALLYLQNEKNIRTCYIRRGP